MNYRICGRYYGIGRAYLLKPTSPFPVDVVCGVIARMKQADALNGLAVEYWMTPA